MSTPARMNSVSLPAPRKVLKQMVFGVCLLLVSPLVVLVWLEKRLTRAEAVFIALSQLFSLLPGYPGICLRAAFYFGTLEECSWQIHVGFGSVFTHRAASLGSNVSMGAYCVIGHARIGDQVMMASRVSIPSGKRQHLDDAGRLSSSVSRFDTVAVGSRSWVGEGAIIMADVGDACIVSAGSVVGKPVRDCCLVGGNPARVIRVLGAGENQRES